MPLILHPIRYVIARKTDVQYSRFRTSASRLISVNVWPRTSMESVVAVVFESVVYPVTASVS